MQQQKRVKDLHNKVSRTVSKLAKSSEKVKILEGEVHEHKEKEKARAYLHKKDEVHEEILEACVEKVTTTLK